MRMIPERSRGIAGQSTAEYAIVIGLVIAAIVAMQVYVRRGWQGRAKVVVDNVGWGLKASTAGSGKITTLTSQYEPYYSESTYDVTQDTAATRKVAEGFVVSKTGISETTTRAVGGHTTQGVDLTQDDTWR